MTDDEIIIEVAKLAGLPEPHNPTPDEIETGSYYQFEPPFLTSRDVIIPVIEKHWRSLLSGSEPTLESEGFLVTFGEICEQLCRDEVEWSITPVYRFVLMKPRQLCVALLRATGRWKE